VGVNDVSIGQTLQIIHQAPIKQHPATACGVELPIIRYAFLPASPWPASLGTMCRLHDVAGVNLDGRKGFTGTMPKTMKSPARDRLMETLKARFEKHMQRHRGIAWAAVEARLEGNPDAMTSLRAMEASGGEPDVIGEGTSEHITFCDCSAESPIGRRSVCYDKEARVSRKENKPYGSAVEMAAELGIELLTEEQYRELQQLGEFDTKTSSWVHTPPEVRSLGGALYCDRRYGRVFLYHNGAQSYYAARGFRGRLRV
jgi:Protein of unknown function (DUF4256)